MSHGWTTKKISIRCLTAGLQKAFKCLVLAIRSVFKGSNEFMEHIADCKWPNTWTNPNPKRNLSR